MHEIYLKLALTQAKRRQGCTAPNPAVGAVIVKDSRLIATGFHRGSGYPHAETEALAVAGINARGATLYITLEPCCHWGKTPPCTQAIIEAGVKQVIYAYQDPDQRVAGQSKPLLERAGIACWHYPMPEISAFYSAYAYWQQKRMPWVTAKLALSLNGKIAGPKGEPIAITGDVLNQLTHKQRRCHDVLLTTAQTINCDDPHLNVRFKGKGFAKPLYIVDTHLKIRDNARVLQQKAPVTLLHGLDFDPAKAAKLIERGIRLQAVSQAELGLDLTAIFSQIANDGYHSVWVEAGAQLFKRLLLCPWLNQAYLYVGARTIGEGLAAGLEAPEWFADFKGFQIYAAGQDALCELWR